MSSDYLGKSFVTMRVGDIQTEDILRCLKRTWDKTPVTASRIRGRLELVLAYSKAMGWRPMDSFNPATWRGHLSHMLPKPTQRGHHPALAYESVPKFMSDLADREEVSATALRFIILCANRLGEALGATWDEIDFQKKLWSIPPHRMKKNRPHQVPLSEPALAILRERWRVRTSDSGFIFAGRTPGQRMKNAEIHKLMADLGFAKKPGERPEATPHGFRSSFRDWCGNETHYARDVAEESLSHVIGDSVERAYRRSTALEKRRRLMSDWGAYCTGEPWGKLLPFPAAANAE